MTYVIYWGLAAVVIVGLVIRAIFKKNSIVDYLPGFFVVAFAAFMASMLTSFGHQNAHDEAVRQQKVNKVAVTLIKNYKLQSVNVVDIDNASLEYVNKDGFVCDGHYYVLSTGDIMLKDGSSCVGLVAKVDG